MPLEQEFGYPDHDRGAHLAATYITGCALTLIFVVGRLCARFSIAGIGIDDWCMLVTWIVFLPLTVLVSLFSLSGGTRHLVYLVQDPLQMTYLVKLNWIAQPLAIFCLGSTKISVAFLIIRLLNRASVWRRYSLYVASAITTANTIIMIVLTFAQCEDPAALWDGDVKSRTKCWDPAIQSSFSIYGAACHAAMDFFLAALPISLVWGLRTEVRKKVGLCVLLGCGCITGVCSAVKATKLSALNARSDITWETYGLFMWTGIEIIVSIVCGSIPALKPVYALCMGRRPTTGRSSQRYAGGSGSRKVVSRPSFIKGTDTGSQAPLAMEVVEPARSMVGIGRSRGGWDEDEVGIVGTGRTSSTGSGSGGEMGEEKKMGMKGGIQVTRTVDVVY
ncbi:hypothetical protein B0J11DRAFT_508831 [Dendryphion nanum]|uniref:Rhodopsin domain-containing protein n=1 Tax=Dendryphion nanum TaxID=256645 RepID=A0A9P9IEF7_9PLEO|nr:hypothetical protein B0J11DRAFT_508831 [Dendryphion nanum]